ncbi:MAG: J domain-containing protein [Anaerovoracaceae bacterium]
MDKKPYYRLLGLTEGATAAQIKDAYEKKMHKLRSDDYADDPEYVARKIQEVRHAYSVLTGGAAPATRAQKEARFEKWKDAQDEGEDAIREAKKAFRTGASKLKALGHDAVCDLDDEAAEKGSRVFQSGSGGRKKTYYAPHERGAKKEGQNQLRSKIIAVAVVLFLGSGILSTCTELITDSFNEPVPEIQLEESEMIEIIQQKADEIDYDTCLDFSDYEAFADQIEWELSDETAEALFDNTQELAWSMGLYDVESAVTAITGDENFYWENDDLTNARTLASLMNPPAFEEIAGAISWYSGEVILNYNDYLQFLCDVAEDQLR